jgi:hypothetical protein
MGFSPGGVSYSQTGRGASNETPADPSRASAISVLRSCALRKPSRIPNHAPSGPSRKIPLPTRVTHP